MGMFITSAANVVSIAGFPGADPTGATSSQAAFNAAVASGRVVVIPEGVFLLDATTTIAGPTTPAERTVLTFTATNGTDTITHAGADIPSLTKVRLRNSGGALPGGLSTLTDYWTIRQSATTSKLAASQALAIAGTPIDLTTDGTGTHSLYTLVVTCPGLSFQGGMIRQANSTTTTIGCPIYAPAAKIFDNALAGQGTIRFRPSRDPVAPVVLMPEWWGAVGDASTLSIGSHVAGSTTLPNNSGLLDVGQHSGKKVILFTPIALTTTFTADNTTEIITHAAYEYEDFTRVMLRNVGGALPAGLDATTIYYTIRQSATTSKLATSFVNAKAGTAVNFTTNGTGTHTIYPEGGYFHATTIVSVESNTSATMAAAPVRSYAGMSMALGTDDSAAFNAMVAASEGFMRCQCQSGKSYGLANPIMFLGGTGLAPWIDLNNATLIALDRMTTGMFSTDDDADGNNNQGGWGGITRGTINCSNAAANGLCHARAKRVATGGGATTLIDATAKFCDMGTGYTFTADNTTEIITHAGIDIPHLTKVRVSNSGGGLPTNLATATDYWTIRQSATTSKLAASQALAIAGTAINLASNGTGTHTIWPFVSTADFNNSWALFEGQEIYNHTEGVVARILTVDSPTQLTLDTSAVTSWSGDTYSARGTLADYPVIGAAAGIYHGLTINNAREIGVHVVGTQEVIFSQITSRYSGAENFKMVGLNACLITACFAQLGRGIRRPGWTLDGLPTIGSGGCTMVGCGAEGNTFTYHNANGFEFRNVGGNGDGSVIRFSGGWTEGVYTAFVVDREGCVIEGGNFTGEGYPVYVTKNAHGTKVRDLTCGFTLGNGTVIEAGALACDGIGSNYNATGNGYSEPVYQGWVGDRPHRNADLIARGKLGIRTANPGRYLQNMGVLRTAIESAEGSIHAGNGSVVVDRGAVRTPFGGFGRSHNLIKDPCNLTTSNWTGGRVSTYVTVTANYGRAPDGSMTATRFRNKGRTATGGGATTLVDATATFVTWAVAPGDKVYNTTENIFAYVVTVDSETQLTLSAAATDWNGDEYWIDRAGFPGFSSWFQWQQPDLNVLGYKTTGGHDGFVVVDTTANTIGTSRDFDPYTKVRLTTFGTLPAPFALVTDYYVIRISAGLFKLATTYDNAVAGTAIDITDVGAGLTFTATNGSDIITHAGGDLPNATRIRVSNSGGALPAGLAAATDYWTVRQSSTTSMLAASFLDATAATPVTINFTTDGTGTHTLYAHTIAPTDGENYVFSSWIQSNITSTAGASSTANVIIDPSARFLGWGVQPGDPIRNLTENKTGHVVSVDSENQISVTAGSVEEFISSWANDTYSVPIGVGLQVSSGNGSIISTSNTPAAVADWHPRTFSLGINSTSASFTTTAASFVRCQFNPVTRGFTNVRPMDILVWGLQLERVPPGHPRVPGPFVNQTTLSPSESMPVMGPSHPWSHASAPFWLKLPVSSALADAAVLYTVPADLKALQVRDLYWDTERPWTGGTNSTIGVSSSNASYSTKGDLLGGRAGDASAVATAGINRGTRGAKIVTTEASGTPLYALKAAADGAAATTTAETLVGRSPTALPSGHIIYLTPAAGLTADDTNYATITLYKRTAGGGTTTIGQILTKITGGGTGNWTAWNPVAIVTSQPVSEGDAITYDIAKAGTGVVVPACVLNSGKEQVKPIILNPGDTIRYDEITSAFTAGNGCVWVECIAIG